MLLSVLSGNALPSSELPRASMPASSPVPLVSLLLHAIVAASAKRDAPHTTDDFIRALYGRLEAASRRPVTS